MHQSFTPSVYKKLVSFWGFYKSFTVVLDSIRVVKTPNQSLILSSKYKGLRAYQSA